MIHRPKAGETEDDLLRQEEEFLKQSGKLTTRKRTLDAETGDDCSNSVSGVIGDIVEKNTTTTSAHHSIRNSSSLSKGFPTLFNIDPNITTSKKSKKSLFALHMERSKSVNNEACPQRSGEEDNAPNPCSSKFELNIDGGYTGGGKDVALSPESINSRSEMESIHNENLEKLAKMPEAEILEAQKKLLETLDPKIIELLRGKSKSKTISTSKDRTGDIEMNDVDAVEIGEEIEGKLAEYVGEKWVHIDFVEKEKLEWLGDIPDSKCLEPNQPYSARFDFKGELQPFASDSIDVTKSLHHHGDEPQRPGYTIQELYQLSRSTVLQQRILAINTLANIIRKTKLGYYDVCFDGHLLHKLLEADLFLLLRFSIDENALFPAVINCLRRLLHNDTDEYCLDKLLGITNVDTQPLLFDDADASEEEEKELKDNAIIDCDLVKGVLRTDLLVRIAYILNNLNVDRETITNSIMCFIRISRHSPESCKRILTTSNLLTFVYSNINGDRPIYQGVKLFRLLVGQSKELASEIISNYPMKFLISFINADSMTEISKSESYLLKLESIYLWRNLLRHGLMVEELTSWTPCFLRLLTFYTEKVDLCGDGDFDFEFFTALLSLLTVSVAQRCDIDANYIALMYTCTEKWLKQLIHFGRYSYAGVKALGSCLRFFAEYFKVFKVDRTGLGFILKINSVISTLLNSRVFEIMSSNLTEYSHILRVESVGRDPKNLPSLSSVYGEGRDFLKIVHDQSPLPFFVPFVKYLARSYSVSHDCKDSIENFLHFPNVRMYIGKFAKSQRNVENWFTKYEIEFLTDVAQLLSAINDEDVLRLGFRLLPVVRVDDENAKSVVSLLTKMPGSVEKFDKLPSVYLENICKPFFNGETAARYKSRLIGNDWPYRVLGLLRGREAVAEVSSILRFIRTTLERDSKLLERIPLGVRYYYLCHVFLTDCNVFDDEIQREMRWNLGAILADRDRVRLDRRIDDNKPFYDLYTELITQYAGVSYGLHIFAEFVLFPLQNRFDVSLRKLLWSEYLHVLRVVTLPHPASDFVDVEEFLEPCETDESLLVTYLNSVSNGVILRNRNPFVYHVAVGNVRKYLTSDGADSKLKHFLMRKIEILKNEKLKEELTG